MAVPTAILSPVMQAETAPAARDGQVNFRPPVKSLVSWCVAIVLAAVATTASALPPTFMIEQVYSNAAGTVQFVVIRDQGQRNCDAGENLWAGETLKSSGGPGPAQTFVFPTNLPTCATSDKRILIATQAFAALGIVSPDYVIPNGFIPIPNGALEFARVSFEPYTSLPNDGVTAILAGGTRIRNLATNLAGQSASVTGAPGFSINYGTGGTWYNAATSGQGFFVEVVPSLNLMVVAWFTWTNTPGVHDWITAIGPISGDSATLDLQRSTGGKFNDPTTVTTASVGAATARFTSCSAGTITFQRNDLGLSGTIPITRLTVTPAACTTPTSAAADD